MSDQRIPISQLSETQTAPDASYIAIDDGSLTKKITVENFNSTSTASAQQYANQAAASAQTVEDNIATSAAQIREATLAAREATQASTAATASATSAYDSASLAQNYSANASTSAGQAMNAADSSAQNVTTSKGYAEDSEAWAVGKRNGTDVPSSDVAYHNNAKYYSDNASSDADRAEAAAQSITVPDTTLTVSGVAADSKATGDRISSVNAELADVRVMANGKTASTAGDAVREQITELTNDFGQIVTGEKSLFNLNTTWEQGGVNNTGEYSSWSRIRTGFIDVSDLGEISFVAAEGYVLMYCVYDDTQSFIRIGGGWSSNADTKIDDGEKYIRLQVRKEPEANLSPSAGSNITASGLYRVTTIIYGTKEGLDATNGMIPSGFMQNAVWELGTLDGNGLPSSSYSRIRTKDFIDVTSNPILYFSVDSGYKYSVSIYDTSREFIGNAFGGWMTEDRKLVVSDETSYIKVILSHDPDESMTNTAISQYFHVTADSMLTGTVNVLSAEAAANRGTNILSSVPWERGTLDANGQFVSSTSRIVTSDYIDASATEAILFDVNDGYKYSVNAYDSEHNYLETTGWRYRSNFYMMPSSAAYIKIIMAKEPDAWLADASISSNLKGYDKSEYAGLAGGAENGNLEELNWFNATAVNKLEIPTLDSNTTILALGDSITAAQDETGWVYHFRNMTGCTVNDRAVGGTSYGESATSDSGHWMMTQIGNVPAAMWESADLVIMSCGTNDYGHGTPLAELKAKVQECITAIKAKTNVPIVVITPIRRGTGLNSDPMLKMPVFAGIISNVALANQCNVICGFDIPLPAYTTGYVDSMTQDNLHPDAIGANVYARAVINALI